MTSWQPPRRFAPDTLPHERPACLRCSKCHPGRQFGGPELCQRPACECHREES